VIEFAEGPNGIFIAHERLERFGGANGERPGQLVFDRSLKGGHLGQFGLFDPYDPSVLYSAFRKSSTELQDETIRFTRSLATLLSSLGYFHLEVGSTRRPSSADIVPRITYRGDSIPSYLLGLRDAPEHKQLYEAIENDLKQLLPNKLKEIRLIPMERGDIGLAFEFEGYDGFLIAPEQSDGTLLTLALLCIVHQPSFPKLLCLEEPENGIHPRRLQWLFDNLVSLAYPQEGHEPVQVLVSTHSPYLLDFFKDRPSAIRIVEGKDGRSTVRPLTSEEVSSDIPLGHQWFMGLFGGV
jgi:predicted ATPase